MITHMITSLLLRKLEISWLRQWAHMMSGVEVLLLVF